MSNTSAITYMGTKRALAKTVANVVSEFKPGPFLDLFSGVCTVGSSVGTSRQIWSNDMQLFSNLVARTRFCNDISKHSSIAMASKFHAIFMQNRASLNSKWELMMLEEKGALINGDIATLSNLFEKSILDSQRTQKKLDDKEEANQITARFSGTYFSISQALDIDAISYALIELKKLNIISLNDCDRVTLALCIACSKCATTTGHFAQPQKPNVSNLPKYLAQRRRTIWSEWMKALETITCIGSKSWRRKNRIFQKDALDLLSQSFNLKEKPRVVYADPPYTKDQYSRFYHILETIIRYDSPDCVGRGLYRSDRFVSSFCLKTKVEASIKELISSCGSQGYSLVMSYPSHGLLPSSKEVISDFIEKSYKKKPQIIEVPHTHSTMGASSGVVADVVTEILYCVSAK